ncbi:large eukaryotic DNA virus major capsid protein-domain-containing protein [Catenaria anguillulae PL171]|uniref:Large eukaryotic DNA virus major capsid protein-domain-containing protein n=1 Tax=Catenaria anguillulae PL171 TaxID=765915 RepID=A0A1Y2H8B9_9FUNG|nr:large eukaryotic DNA virus major capsid protein-domain-containing protein [Catenaria anguillulae PL171]
MSSGGLLQLVASGTQDVYLTSKPQITFFRVLYRRHTNFAMESMEQTLTGTADFGRKVSCLVARNGDLLHKAYLHIELPALTADNSQHVAWTRNIGHVLLDEISVEIGGSVVDKHYGIWYTIWNELTQAAEKEDGYSVMIGNTTALTTPAATIPAATLYVPLIFWWNRNPGLALPLIALLHHDVKINISFRPFRECYSQYNASTGAVVDDALNVSPSLVDVKLFIDYIFLDAAERKMFASKAHEYLIEQLQYVGSTSYSNSVVREKISFSHPCKELVWVIQPRANVSNGRNRWTDFTTSGASGTPYAGGDPLVDAKIQLGAHDRISTRKAGYFNLVQPYYHHSRMPATGIYVYSFALNPEQHQPSGTLNMSRVESLNLNMTLATGTDPVQVYPFAVNYNVLRITSGMGGVAFAS